MFLELSGFSRTKTMSTVRNVIIKNKSTKYMVWIPYDIVYSEVSTWFHNRLYIFIAQCPLTWVGRGVGFSVWYWSGGTFGQTETPALASQLWVEFEKNGWFPVQISDDFVILISWYLLQIDALWVKKKKKNISSEFALGYWYRMPIPLVYTSLFNWAELGFSVFPICILCKT